MTRLDDQQNPARTAGFFVANPDDGIFTVDTHHIRSHLDAGHFIVDHGRVAIVDTGTALGVPHLLAALDALHLSRDQVDWILLTHIHLDHAGGAGELLRHLPNATVAVHPRGARHLVDPTKLVAATIEVYGDEFFKNLYGAVVPVPADRVVACEDDTELSLGHRRIAVWHTPGHALHHQVYVDQFARVILAGDAFGVSYREFDLADKQFIMPATTPSQLDPPAMIASIQRICAYNPKAVYVTHYSRLHHVAVLGEELIELVHQFTACAIRMHQAGGTPADLKQSLESIVFERLDRFGDQQTTARRRQLLDLDLELDAQGLWHWVTRQTP